MADPLDAIREGIARALWAFAFADDPFAPSWDEADVEEQDASLASGAAVVEALGIEQVGVDWCPQHEGVRNEDETFCDMHRYDIGDCQLSPVFRLRGVEPDPEEAPGE